MSAWMWWVGWLVMSMIGARVCQNGLARWQYSHAKTCNHSDRYGVCWSSLCDMTRSTVARALWSLLFGQLWPLVLLAAPLIIAPTGIERRTAKAEREAAELASLRKQAKELGLPLP